MSAFAAAQYSSLIPRAHTVPALRSLALEVAAQFPGDEFASSPIDVIAVNPVRLPVRLPAAR